MRDLERQAQRGRPVALDLAVAQFGEVWGLACLDRVTWPTFWVLYRRLPNLWALQRVNQARATSMGFGGDEAGRQFADDQRKAFDAQS